MIVCSCNILSDVQILSMLQGQDRARPCSPAKAYRGLGCAPRCGRCVPTIRALLAEAHIANCEASCQKCPSDLQNGADEGEEESAILPIAAE
ncbi:MAG: (2Fe-2S)-binding protein [Hyphomicrobiales bacterium]|nr:(2Fe-2S)-binding protein [Hyphomicrobiales bacterium]